MDILAEVGRRLGDSVLMWRRADLGGSDVDLLVAAHARRPLARLFLRAGLRPAPGDPGHVVWRSRPGTGRKPIDVVHTADWPSYYPSVRGLFNRATQRPDGPAVASPADRALVLAVDAVAGRPVAKVSHRLHALVGELDDTFYEVARAEGLLEVGALATNPRRLTAQARRGRLPYRRVIPLAVRSRATRAAVRERLNARGRRLLPGTSRGPRAIRPPFLIAVSGMDGSGKSTAAEVMRASLEEHGLPATVVWTRLGMKGAWLDHLAIAVKGIVRPPGPIADPVAAGGPLLEGTRPPADASRRGSLLSWGWVLLVAGANVRSARRAGRLRGRGTSVICDRWATDALVDLEVRYGRHRLAEWVAGTWSPRADLEILLDIDATTAAGRKPGDQAERVLRAMERSYGEWARRRPVRILDARAPLATVEAEVKQQVEKLLDEQGHLAPENSLEVAA